MFNLKSTPCLNNFKKDWNGVSVLEVTNFELVSIATAQDQNKDFTTAFRKALGTNPPKPNQVLAVKKGSVMWTGQGQYLVKLDGVNIDADMDLAKALADTGYTALQSDAWVCLNVSGNRIYDVFERFIPLNLRESPKDFASRTSAHHMAVIVMKEIDGSYNLMTPRSSAASFLEGLRHTIENVLG